MLVLRAMNLFTIDLMEIKKRQINNEPLDYRDVILSQLKEEGTIDFIVNNELLSVNVDLKTNHTYISSFQFNNDKMKINIENKNLFDGINEVCKTLSINVQEFKLKELIENFKEPKKDKNFNKLINNE